MNSQSIKYLLKRHKQSKKIRREVVPEKLLSELLNLLKILREYQYARDKRRTVQTRQYLVAEVIDPTKLADEPRIG